MTGRRGSPAVLGNTQKVRLGPFAAAEDSLNMSNATARTTFILPVAEAREKAREIINRVSGNGSTPVIESWRQRSDGQIEFTVRTLRASD
jgi:hypothetical protein